MSLEYQNSQEKYKTAADIQREVDITVDELQYMNSMEYQVYRNKMNLIDNQLVILLNKLKNKYQERKQYFNDTMYEEISESIVMNGIGFPIPEKFINEMEQTVLNKIRPSIPSDFALNVKAIPVEHIKTGENIYKEVKQYEINVSLRELEKENVEEKPKTK